MRKRTLNWGLPTALSSGKQLKTATKIVLRGSGGVWGVTPPISIINLKFEKRKWSDFRAYNEFCDKEIALIFFKIVFVGKDELRSKTRLSSKLC